MQQSNASNFPLNWLGGVQEFKNNVMNLASSLNTGELVEVVDVDVTADAPVGFVSVKFLTLRTNPDNDNVELGVVHNVPYFRVSGGKNAFICDPEIGDIGFCGFSSRDTSLVKRVRGQASQNVSRVSDESDAFYFGGWSKESAEQYVWFDGDDIRIKANTRVLIEAPLTEVQNLKVNGTIESSGAVTSATSINDPKGSMQALRDTYNSHSHLENGQGQNTNNPNQQM